MSETPTGGPSGEDAWTLGDATRAFARVEADGPNESFATVVPHEEKAADEVAEVEEVAETKSVTDPDGPAEVTAVSKLLGRLKMRRAGEKPADEKAADVKSAAASSLETTGARTDALADTVAMPAANTDGSLPMSMTTGATAADAVDDATAKTEVIAQPPARTTAPQDSRRLRPTRKARLRISRIDPWSVMKTSLLFSIAFSIIGFVAVWVLWMIVAASGALEAMQDAITAIVGNPDGSGGFELARYIDQGRVLGFTAVVSVINVVLMTAIATLISFLYNLAATVLGGLEVTLAED